MVEDGEEGVHGSARNVSGTETGAGEEGEGRRARAEEGEGEGAGLPEEPEEQEEENVDEETLGNMTSRQRRLFEIRLKMNKVGRG